MMLRGNGEEYLSSMTSDKEEDVVTDAVETVFSEGGQFVRLSLPT